MYEHGNVETPTRFHDGEPTISLIRRNWDNMIDMMELEERRKKYYNQLNTRGKVQGGD